LKKIYTLVCAWVLMLISFIGSPVSAQAGERENEKYTISSYQNYLDSVVKSTALSPSNTSSNNEFISNLAKDFNGLSPSKQQQIVDLINDPERYISLLNKASMLKPGEIKELGSGVKIESTTPLSTISRTNTTGKIALSIWGVELTNFKLTVFYSYSGHNYVTDTHDARTSHNNGNPGIRISDGDATHWVGGGWAYATGSFEVTGFFGWPSATKIMNMNADPRGFNATIK
jgi:hypothetical protein